MCISKKGLSLVILLLIGSSSVFAMNPQDRAKQRRQEQEAAEQKRRQEQIDRKMREDIKKAGSTRTVQINPNTSFNVHLDATTHNITARHNQNMQNLKRK